MELVHFDELGAGPWDDFCSQSDGAWLLHTSFWLRYTLALFSGERENQSFAAVENKQILAVCPLIAESREVYGRPLKEFTYNGEACPLPALKNDMPEKKKKNVSKFVYSSIDESAERLAIDRGTFRYHVLASGYYHSPTPVANELVCYGYIENNLRTQSIDLTQENDRLFKGMRSGHRQSVNKANELMTFAVYDRGNISREVFSAYQKMHEKAAGRQTRSESTFNMAYELIEQGNAVLCSAALDGIVIGYALAFVYKKGALYASACNDPDYKYVPVGHGIQWELICYLKSRGVVRYEVGLQNWPQLHYIPSDKERGISKFKRGFGGDSAPVFSGERFYDMDAMKAIFEGRLRDFISYSGMVGSSDCA